MLSYTAVLIYYYYIQLLHGNMLTNFLIGRLKGLATQGSRVSPILTHIRSFFGQKLKRGRLTSGRRSRI